ACPDTRPGRCRDGPPRTRHSGEAHRLKPGDHPRPGTGSEKVFTLSPAYRSSKTAEALQARAVFAAQRVNPADDPQGCTQKAIHEPGDDQTGIATARTTTPRDRANSYTAPEETPLISPLAVENGRT